MRRSFFCTANENCLNKSFSLGTLSFGDGKSQPVKAKVVTDDKAKNTLLIIQNFTHTYARSGTYTPRYTECCWINNQAAAQSYNMTLKVVVKTTSDPFLDTKPTAFSYGTTSIDQDLFQFRGCTNNPLPPNSFRIRSTQSLPITATHTLLQAPTGMTISSKGDLFWPVPQAGLWPVGISLKDTAKRTIGYTMLATVLISDRCPNTKPTLKVTKTGGGTGTITVKPGQRACFDVTGGDTKDKLDKLVYSITPAKVGATAAPLGPQANPSGFRYCWTPVGRDEGITHTINFKVTDTGFPNLSYAEDHKIKVLKEVPPVITVSPAGDTKFMNEGGSYTFSLTGVDTDSNGIASYNIKGLPRFCKSSVATGNPLKVTFACKPSFTDGPKTYTLSLTVTDKDYTPKTTKRTITINVRNVNRGPSFGTIPAEILLNEGQLFTYKIQASDPDGDPLTFRAQGLPSGATLTPDGTFRWLPLQKDVGVHTFTAYVRDDKGIEVKTSIRLRVRNVNDKPSIGSLPPKDATEDKLYSYKVVATDQDPADQGNLKYTLKKGSPNARIDSKTRDRKSVV